MCRVSSAPLSNSRTNCWLLSAVLHTSASLALNESWDPDVRDDMEMMLNKIVPEGLPYRHSCEGPDDMVSRTSTPVSKYLCCLLSIVGPDTAQVAACFVFKGT